ncbi:HlyC/CorC family transporter [Arthrobacter gandavensis]|uniref:hemolysin family protein n=1 Tax=Arthrobacter gandavensis TaxID=169960 RepID=UPI00188DFA52|nr:hemolysin family protein [Arthrobacter gandavensis]MBF4995168.1 HlyC/CorC family transporter [Arthrobacter gandavensis]
MDGSGFLNVFLVLFFVLLGGLFAGAEMALVSLREGQILRLEASGRRGARIAALARNPNLFLSAIQIGVTLSGFFSAAYGASALAPALSPVLEGWGLNAAAAGTSAFIAMTLVVAYLSLVFSELVPKRLAMQNAEGFVRALAPPLSVFAAVMRPVIKLLSVSTNGVVRALGGDPNLKNVPISQQELLEMVKASPVLADESRNILADVFGAGQRLLQEVMRPRPQVKFLQASLSVAEAREAVHVLPYSRYPVIAGSPDDVLGFVHVRDLLGQDSETAGQTRLSGILRPILFLPGTATVLPTLTRMRRENSHIAVVADEYGGTDGIVTLEDLVEELVGEIYDEYDTGKDPEDQHLAMEGEVVVDGGLILQEFDRLTGIQLPEGQYETVAGYILDRLGRMAVPSDTVAAPGGRLRVLDVEHHRIRSVRVIPDVGAG